MVTQRKPRRHLSDTGCSRPCSRSSTRVGREEECADLVTRYRLDVLVRGIEEQVSVVARMADLTHEAMSRLRRPRSLTDYWVEINRLENVANAAHRDVLTELLRPGADPIVVLMEKAVVDALEDAANAFERVADRVESIAVKAA